MAPPRYRVHQCAHPLQASGQIEETAESELRRLGGSLGAVVDDALRTIEADTASAVGRLSTLLQRAWLRPLVVGLSLSLGTVGRSWAGTRWLVVDHRAADRGVDGAPRGHRGGPHDAGPDREDELGVTLREIDGERFVVLPAGTLDAPPWTVGGRLALKLSSE